MIERKSSYWWIAFVFWPLLGGGWGAWVLFQGPYSRITNMNADSFAPAFAWAFAVFFALVGLIAGALICALIGRLVSWFRHRFGMAMITAVAAATLLNVVTLWQIGNILQETYPGLSAESSTQQERVKASKKFVPDDKGAYRNPCLDPPPAIAKDRAIWDAECR